MNKISVGIIGCGYWGKNLIRVFSSIPKIRIKYVVDKDEKKLAALVGLPSGIQKLRETTPLMEDKDLPVIIIATPTETHFQLAKSAFLAGKHVWVEKPITRRHTEALELVKLAKNKNLILHVDHTFLYSGAVTKLKTLMRSGKFGTLRYLDSERINLGIIQPDVNVLWDLAPHDLSIFQYLIGKKPISVVAYGACFATNNRKRPVEEMAHLILTYPEKVMAHISISWISPIKMRRMIIGGSSQMIVYNDIEPIEKIKVYNGKALDLANESSITPTYRASDIVIPQIDNTEPLLNETNHFVDCLIKKSRTRTSGEDGASIVRILEETEKSLANNSEVRYL